jgi:hypothetical protein
MLANAKSNTEALAASAVPYLRIFSTVAGGYMLAKMAVAAYQELFTDGANADFYNAKLMTARFFAEALLPQVYGLMTPVMGGHQTVMQISNEQF